jgi:hypothetical protein
MSFVIVDIDEPPTAFFTVSKDGGGKPIFSKVKEKARCIA